MFLTTMLIMKAGLLIAYFTTFVATEASLDDLYEPPSLDSRILQRLNKNRLVLPIEPEKNYLSDDGHTVEFNINNEKIKLNLTLSTREVVSSKIPIWIVKSTLGQTSNYSYELVKNTKEMLNGQMYVNNESKAVLFARYNRNQNQFLYDGVIGEGSTRRLVYSIPDHSHGRRKRTDDKIENQIIIDSSEIYDSDDEPIIIERNGVELTKMDKPLHILYPKMLIVVDCHLLKYLNFDVAETIRYVATFWNIVDQKYAKIESPKIQVVVNGIIIINDEEALDHIYQYESDTDEFDIHKLLDSTRSYFSKTFINDTGFYDYDAIMIMTGLKMKPLEGFLDIFGLTAKLGGICTRDYNIAITTDNAQYNTLIAIHELGHLLNLSHDYADECDGISYLFDPLKTSVMSAPSDGTDLFWSDCSLRLLKEFSTLKAAECMRNRHRTE